MKAVCILFLAICAVSTSDRSYAAASNRAPQKTSADNSGNNLGKRLSDIQHASPAKGKKSPGAGSGKQRDYGRANASQKVSRVANANRPKQFPNSQTRLATSTRDLSHAGPIKSGAVPKNRPIHDEPVISALAVRSSAMFPSSSPSLGNVRHRGPNPPVIGGFPTSSPNNPGAINGSRVSRKP